MGRVYVDEAFEVVPDRPIALIFRLTAYDLLRRITETLAGHQAPIECLLSGSQHRYQGCRLRRRGSPAKMRTAVVLAFA